MTTETYHGESIVLALGFFDGVHRGHQALLEETKKMGKRLCCKTGVLTFDEHPLERVFPNYTPFLITSNEKKVTLIKSSGIDYVFLSPFTEELMHLSPEAFISEYLLKKYAVKGIVVGFNYNFGYRGVGTPETLTMLGKKHDFEVITSPPIVIHAHTVSSSFIRELISCGQVDAVKTFLGRNYTLKGRVIRGKGLGHQFGIPTANIRSNRRIVLPNTGVYYTQVHYRGQCLHALTNLGFNPTFKKHPFSIETYIYDFDEDVYDEEITIEFLMKIRNEIKFETFEALITQIKTDIEKIRKKFID